ncbi:MAG: response regulator [Selenomonadaceae bacterium]|nr:response regulator [Selenomonadaceae bacterium]
MSDDKSPSETTEHKLRIIITDDSRMLRRKLRADLEALGCEVIEATNGKEAIMLDLQNEPDGMILDIVMPEVGGVEALQVIREVSPDVPIVMLSSAGTPQKLMQTLKMGAVDFIQKPYMKEQLVKVVEMLRREREKRKSRKKIDEATDEATQ